MPKYLILTVLVMLLGSGLGIAPTPALVQSDDSVEGSFSVPEPSESYGFRVVNSALTLFSGQALGTPDRSGAWLLRRGSIVLEMERSVEDCREVNVWLLRIGLRTATFTVSVSQNTRKWRQIGQKQVSSAAYREFTFNGSFGDVKYVKVNFVSASSLINVISLDSVRAEGGET
jgi:hypothetical protein